MPVDNDLYNEPDVWWDDDKPLATLLTLNPTRFGFFRDVLSRRAGLDLDRLRVLDVGCGGGLLAEEFARAGCRVTGVDPSAASLSVATAHAAESGLDIDYQPGVAEALPFPGESFDVVYCCDTLEHVKDVNQAVGEAARVLRPGGHFLYDTFNRTLRSKLGAIKLSQEWSAFSWAPPNLHDWNKFIKPTELESIFRAHGLRNQDRVGFTPGCGPAAMLRLLRSRARGEISYGEFGRRLEMRVSKDTSGSYAGYAQKTTVA